MSYGALINGTTGLVAYWRLGESGGAGTAVDEKTTSPGTYVASPTQGVTGLVTDSPVNTAVTLNGSSQMVSVAHTTQLNIGAPMSIEVWVKFTSLATASIAVIYKGTGLNSFEDPFYLTVRGTGTQFVSGHNWVDVTTSYAFQTGVTYHLVHTYDGSTVCQYVNGAQIRNVPYTSAVTLAANALSIGNYSSTGTGQWLPATVDEVAVYSVALTPAQVAAHYAAGNPTAPGAPTALTGSEASTTSVALTWTAPASDGGLPITGYTVTPYISGVAQTPVATGSTSTSYTVTGLTTGTAYTFTVKATNAIGTGAESAPSPTITPLAAANTGYGDGSYGAGSYGVRSAGATTVTAATGLATAAGGTSTITVALTAVSGAATATGSSVTLGAPRITAAAGTATASGATASLAFSLIAATGLATAVAEPQPNRARSQRLQALRRAVAAQRPSRPRSSRALGPRQRVAARVSRGRHHRCIRGRDGERWDRYRVEDVHLLRCDRYRDGWWRNHGSRGRCYRGIRARDGGRRHPCPSSHRHRRFGRGNSRGRYRIVRADPYRYIGRSDRRGNRPGTHHGLPSGLRAATAGGGTATAAGGSGVSITAAGGTATAAGGSVVAGDPNFPTTPILDTFSGTLANFTTPWRGGGTTALQITGGQLVPVTDGSWSDAAYNTPCGPDCEVYADVTTVVADHWFFIRSPGPPSGSYNVDGYAVGWEAGTLYIQRFTAGTGTVLNSVAMALSSGDGLGCRVTGNRITAWKRSGPTGAWAKMLETSDSTYAAAGYIAVETPSGAYDNFGGGAFGTVNPPVNVTAAAGAATASGGTAALASSVTATTGLATASGGTASLRATYLAATGLATAGGGTATATSGAGGSASGGLATAAGGTTSLAVTLSAASGVATASGGTASEARTLQATAGAASASGGAVSFAPRYIVSGGAATADGGQVFGFVGSIPSTHPPLGGSYDASGSGGILSAHARGGTVTVHTRGGTVTLRPRGGTTQVRVRGGDMPLTRRGGRVITNPRGGVVRDTRSNPDAATGGTLNTDPTGGRITNRPRGGTVQIKLRGGTVAAHSRGGTFTAHARGGIITLKHRGGTYDSAPTGGTVL
jgi:hypothetical protein